jgi:hypothetical protein
LEYYLFLPRNKAFKDPGEDNTEFQDFFDKRRVSNLEMDKNMQGYVQKTPIIINATQTITANHNLYINNVPTQLKFDNKESKENQGKADIDNVLIKTPRLELQTMNSKNEKEQQLISVTPNSINNVIKKQGEKILFGRNDARMKNDFNFYDDSVGVRQFEILYDKSISS